MGEMTDGEWGVVPYPPPEHDPPIERGKPEEKAGKDKKPQPKTDEWPVRKVKGPPKRGG